MLTSSAAGIQSAHLLLSKRSSLCWGPLSSTPVFVSSPPMSRQPAAAEAAGRAAAEAGVLMMMMMWDVDVALVESSLMDRSHRHRTCLLSHNVT